jgi:hypothetical protein
VVSGTQAHASKKKGGRAGRIIYLLYSILTARKSKSPDSPDCIRRPLRSSARYLPPRCRSGITEPFAGGFLLLAEAVGKASPDQKGTARSVSRSAEASKSSSRTGND